MAVPYHTHSFEIPSATRDEVEAGVRSDVAATPASLGSAAAKDVSYFATTSQGSKADTAVQPTLALTAGDGLTGGGTLESNRTFALNSTSLASLALANSAVRSVNGKTGNTITITKVDVSLGSVEDIPPANMPISIATQTALNLKANSAIMISAGAGLTGGGTLLANRSMALDVKSIASLAKADTALQAPGGATGEVLVKASGVNNDVSWQAIASATAVSYAPQTLSTSQKLQARNNIGAVDASGVPVKSVAGKTGDITLSAADINSGVLAVARIPHMQGADGQGYVRICNDLSNSDVLGSIRLYTDGTFAYSFNGVELLKVSTSGVMAVVSIPAALVNSGTLAEARIPTLSAGKIPNLDASKVTSGAFADARIPNLNASKVTAGVFSSARIPALNYASSPYAGGTQNELNFPVGHTILMYRGDAATLNRNATAVPCIHNGDGGQYALRGDGSAGSQLSGTWRNRGIYYTGGGRYMMMQRTA